MKQKAQSILCVLMGIFVKYDGNFTAVFCKADFVNSSTIVNQQEKRHEYVYTMNEYKCLIFYSEYDMLKSVKHTVEQLDRVIDCLKKAVAE